MAKKVEVDLKVLIVAAALVIFATVGSAFATYLIFAGGNGVGFGSNGTDVSVSGDNQREMMGPTFSAGDFTVNLTSNGPTRFIRTGIVMEVSERNTIGELEERRAQVRDRVIAILRSRSTSDLNQTNGLESLRNSIMESVNELLIRGSVVNVYFIDLVIQ